MLRNVAKTMQSDETWTRIKCSGNHFGPSGLSPQPPLRPPKIRATTTIFVRSQDILTADTEIGVRQSAHAMSIAAPLASAAAVGKTLAEGKVGAEG
jgi:hypothetical protein